MQAVRPAVLRFARLDVAFLVVDPHAGLRGDGGGTGLESERDLLVAIGLGAGERAGEEQGAVCDYRVKKI